MKDLLEVSQKIKNYVLPKIIRDLDDLKIVSLSSKQLQEIFHSNGVNMRYLGSALSLTG